MTSTPNNCIHSPTVKRLCLLSKPSWMVLLLVMGKVILKSPTYPYPILHSMNYNNMITLDIRHCSQTISIQFSSYYGGALRLQSSPLNLNEV